MQLTEQKLKSMSATCIRTHEPTNEAIGMLLQKNYLLRPDVLAPIDALLFAADRIDHWQRLISEHLDNKEIVISDRYVDSSVAYQAAQGLSKEWIESINAFAYLPNLTFIMDIDPQQSLVRRYAATQPDQLHKFEKLQFLTSVRENFLEIAKKNSKRCFIIDASKTTEEVFAQIWAILEPRITAFVTVQVDSHN